MSSRSELNNLLISVSQVRKFIKLNMFEGKPGLFIILEVLWLLNIYYYELSTASPPVEDCRLAVESS
jgi:hypothetical protein